MPLPEDASSQHESNAAGGTISSESYRTAVSSGHHVASGKEMRSSRGSMFSSTLSESSLRPISETGYLDADELQSSESRSQSLSPTRSSSSLKICPSSAPTSRKERNRPIETSISMSNSKSEEILPSHEDDNNFPVEEPESYHETFITDNLPDTIMSIREEIKAGSSDLSTIVTHPQVHTYSGARVPYRMRAESVPHLVKYRLQSSSPSTTSSLSKSSTSSTIAVSASPSSSVVTRRRREGVSRMLPPKDLHPDGPYYPQGNVFRRFSTPQECLSAGVSSPNDDTQSSRGSQATPRMGHRSSLGVRRLSEFKALTTSLGVHIQGSLLSLAGTYDKTFKVSLFRYKYSMFITLLIYFIIFMVFINKHYLIVVSYM